MRGKRRLTRQNAEALGRRERLLGIDPEDEAAQWLREHEPEPEQAPPKSLTKSKHLHRWRQRQARGER